MGKLAEVADAGSLEVCMASSVTQVRSSKLFLMCAGEKPIFARVEELVEQLSENGRLLRYIRPAGRAAQVKALVNMVMNINTAGLVEGLGLGAALGLGLKMRMEVFAQTGANSRVLAADGEDMINREHPCYFSVVQATKDSGIAPSITSPIPGMPHGKPAGIPCVQLLPDYRCAIFGRPERPAFCASLRPHESMCGRDRGEAMDILQRLEVATGPD